jgi:hypothetical protein
MADAIRTPHGVVHFPHLFVPKPIVPGGDPRYSLMLLFDATAQATDQYKGLRLAVAAAIDEKWGKGKSTDKNFVGGLRLPFRKGEEKDRYTGFVPGTIFIAPWTKTKPGVVDPRNQPIEIATDVWSGQLAHCTVKAFAYDTGGNRGVNFMLSNVQIVKANMPRLDGRRSASQEFGVIEGSDEDLAAAGLDEASLENAPAF